MNPTRSNTATGFTLVEMLVVITVVSLLVGIVLPALASSFDSARGLVCMSNQRQLGLAWTMYADDHRGKAMPHLAPGQVDRVYWYGAEDFASRSVVHERGTIAPYLDANLGAHSVFECPEQPEGTYREQGRYRQFTTTYGYNAYTLASRTSGYFDLVDRRWTAVHDLERPSELFVFADTLISLWGSEPSNSALLDPPKLFSRSRGWRTNTSPTTAFRHGDSGLGFGRAFAARADGSISSEMVSRSAVNLPEYGIGSVTSENDPHYVPDWERWR